jgi:hypothetical protein
MSQGSRSTGLFPLIQFHHDLIQNEKPIGREEKIELYWFNRILDHSIKDKWMRAGRLPEGCLFREHEAARDRQYGAIE